MLLAGDDEISRAGGIATRVWRRKLLRRVRSAFVAHAGMNEVLKAFRCVVPA